MLGLEPRGWGLRLKGGGQTEEDLEKEEEEAKDKFLLCVKAVFGPFGAAAQRCIYLYYFHEK